MPLTRTQKEERVVEASEVLSSAVSVVFMTYDALSVVDINELRDKMHEQGVRMRVIPKRLLKLATVKTKLAFDPTEHEGQVALVWGSDAIAPAKVLYEFAQEHAEQVKLIAGTMAGVELDAKEVNALAQLPSRDELLGKLVGTLSNPIRSLASVMSGVQRNTVYVLQAIAASKS